MYAKYTTTLPPTPCTEDMREKIVAYSAMNGQSLSETKRQAIAFFLAHFGQNTTKDSSSIDQKEGTDER